MQGGIPEISMREALHFLGWRGSPVEKQILDQIRYAMDEVRDALKAQVIFHYFELCADRSLEGTVFIPKGSDILAMLASCDGAILMAATLGVPSERLLLRHQAKSSANALIFDAVLSAAIEAVCDEQERRLRTQYAEKGMYLTDRFSPGYGDMPIEQTKEICAVLQTEKSIGLSVAQSGIMIPRKSVTAILGVSREKQIRRPSPCSLCSMNRTCAMREMR